MGTRFVASLIDSALLVALVIVWAVVGQVLSSLALNADYSAYTVITLMTSLGVWVIVLGGWALYAVAIGRIGQSVGKRTMGVRVVDVTTGGDIGVGRAFLRWLVFWLMGLPCYLGYISYFTDGTGRNRALHDKAADDVVVLAQGVPIVQSVKDVLAAVRGAAR